MFSFFSIDKKKAESASEDEPLSKKSKPDMDVRSGSAGVASSGGAVGGGQEQAPHKIEQGRCFGPKYINNKTKRFSAFLATNV